MSTGRPSKPDMDDIVTMSGVDRDLWRWLRAFGALKGQFAGEAVSDMLAWYRSAVDGACSGLPPGVEKSSKGSHGIVVRGVERELWRWLKARALQDRLTLYRMFNGIMQVYKDREEACGRTRTPRKRFTNICFTCSKPFQTDREDALVCSNRCRVARHRQLKKEGR